MKSRWGWRVSAVALVLGTGTVMTQASEFEGANNNHQQNPFERILHKLDKILDAIKAGGGSEPASGAAIRHFAGVQQRGGVR